MPREKVQIATKFGIARRDQNSNALIMKGTPEYVRSCCEASLKRLDVDYIDLYYYHRVDTSVPIEDTVSDPLALFSKFILFLIKFEVYLLAGRNG